MNNMNFPLKHQEVLINQRTVCPGLLTFLLSQMESYQTIVSDIVYAVHLFLSYLKKWRRTKWREEQKGEIVLLYFFKKGRKRCSGLVILSRAIVVQCTKKVIHITSNSRSVSILSVYNYIMK